MLCGVDFFVVTFANDFNDLVVVWLFRLQVYAREFCQDVGVCNIWFDQAFIVFEVIVLPVVLLSFSFEKFDGVCFVLFLVALSSVFNNCDDSIWNGERSNGAWFLDYTCIDVEYLVCALVVSGWAKEYSLECVGAHCVCYSWVVVGFNVGAKGGDAVFVEV